MRTVATFDTHEVVEVDPNTETLPEGYDAEKRHCYVETKSYVDAKPGLRYYTRTTLTPDAQMKIWDGLIDPAVVEGLLLSDTVASEVECYVGVVKGKLKLTLACGLVGIFKPEASDSEDGYAWSEIAAYQVDKAIGAGMVPVTVRRQHPTGSGTFGSFQLWVEGVEFSNVNHFTNDHRFFDRLIANTDRAQVTGQNCLMHVKTGRIVLIDNGLCFTAMVTANNVVRELASLMPAEQLLIRLKQLNASGIAALPKKHQDELAKRSKMLLFVMENKCEPKSGELNA